MSRPTTEADRERAARRTIEHVEREVAKNGGSSDKAAREAAEAIRKHQRKQGER